MGMSGWQLLWRVEVPLAFPLIMTGVRSAAVQVVATATLAALPGGGGLGRIITAGFGTYDTPQVVAGAALVAVLALAVEGVLVVAERLLDPMRGRRRSGKSAKDGSGSRPRTTVSGSGGPGSGSAETASAETASGFDGKVMPAQPTS